MTNELSDELPDALHAQVSALSERGNIMLESGDAKAAIGLWMQALQLLPQPTQRWEAAMWLHASIADAYRSTGDLENAVYHLRIAYESEDGAANPFVLISLGATLYDLGKIDDSVDPLLRAYMLEGTEIFEEFGGPYLKVLKDRNLIQ